MPVVTAPTRPTSVSGVTFSGTPSVGDVPTATSATAATWQPAGAAPHTFDISFGPATSVANNGQVSLSWGTSSGPDTLLNRTAPALPTIITTGVYAVTVQFGGQNFTVGGYMTGRLELDPATTDWEGDAASALATAGDDPQVSLSATMYLVAGMALKATVLNRDGVSARDIFVSGLVQRIS